jgi:Ulp1 family protease
VFFAQIHRSDPAYVVAQTCPQQPNGYDCGVYVVLFAKYLASALKQLPDEGTFTADPEDINWGKICDDMGPQGSSWVTPERADEHRKEVHAELVGFMNANAASEPEREREREPEPEPERGSETEELHGREC